MKTTLKVLTAIMALGLLILLGLHLFLQYGLTKAMREVVLPRIKAETGIDVRVGGVSINLPNGLVFLKEVTVKNPEGFLLENLASVDRVRVEVDLASLLKRKPFLVKNMEVEEAWINVIRNKEGEVNLSRLQAPHPLPLRPAVPPKSPKHDTIPDSGEVQVATRPAEHRPLPEVLIQGLSGNVRIRYLDFRLDQLDVVLDLGVSGSNLSTLQDSSLPWGDLAMIGSLGDDRTRFITDIKIRLAPLADPSNPSFDLTGKVMEIDPRIMEVAYSKLGIRSDPFGLDPVVHCRKSRFENSSISLNLRDIELEDKLSDRLGGMASIGSLRFVVPLEGTLQDPVFDMQSSLLSALGDGNARSLLDAFLKGAAARETGKQDSPESLADAAVEVLGVHVEEIGESEAAKQALKDLMDRGGTATNTPSPASSDVLIDILGEQVEEIGENEEVKDELKSLGKWLFGK